MANRYANLTPTKKISEDFQTITTGFDKVQQDMDGKAPSSVGTGLASHVGDTRIHVTPTDKSNWNGKAPGNTRTDLDNHIGSRGAAHGNATQTEAGFMSKDDKTKLNGVEAGAEKNKSGFSSVNDVAAGLPEDTLTVEGGTGITITTNPVTKKLTITATGEATPGAHGPSHNSDGADPIPDLVALQNKVTGLAGAGRTMETVKGNADALTAHKADYTQLKNSGISSIVSFQCHAPFRAVAGCYNGRKIYLCCN